MNIEKEAGIELARLRRQINKEFDELERCKLRIEVLTRSISQLRETPEKYFEIKKIIFDKFGF